MARSREGRDIPEQRGKWLGFYIVRSDCPGIGCWARAARLSYAEILPSSSGYGWRVKECAFEAGESI
jgi:hypothetical protein